MNDVSELKVIEKMLRILSTSLSISKNEMAVVQDRISKIEIQIKEYEDMKAELVGGNT